MNIGNKGKGQRAEGRGQRGERERLKVIVFYVTDNGFEVAQRIKKLYLKAQVLKFKQEIVSRFWDKSRSLIFIMATGIVVRTIATLIKDKRIDPSVVVLDEKGKFAISLLSGHIGGANKVAKEIADFLGSEAVITTVSQHPQNLVIGIGCNSKTSEIEIENAVRSVFSENNLSFLSIYLIATINKRCKEPGLVEFAQKYGLKIVGFTPGELNSVMDVEKKDVVFKAMGAYAVSEPAALLASGNNKLLLAKQRLGNVTIAIAEKKKREKGKIYLIGIGPGNIKYIIPYAEEAIRKSEVIVGYSAYLNQIQGLIKDKEIIPKEMTQEIERCKKAVELAQEGKIVSLISGGDAGIYGIAGLVFEILKNQKLVEIEVIPGIPALNACAAKLGAPLTHDFACISLSDRLTPWEIIKKRLESAALADFVIILYNPKSKTRFKQIEKAKEIIMKHRHGKIPVGIVRAVTRGNESVIITNLENMLNYGIDMQTTIIIGNSKSFVWLNWIITPRGYGV